VAKQFLALGDEPIFIHAVRALASLSGGDTSGPDRPALHFRGAVLVSPQSDLEAMKREVAEHLEAVAVSAVVAGGVERSDSVRNGLHALAGLGAGGDDVVLIHDGVRPFPPVEKLSELCRMASPDGAILASPCKDTVKVLDGDVITATLDRSKLALAQTPQAFVLARITAAHEEAAARGLAVTDDASVIEAVGGKVRVVAGDVRNMKITTPDDLAVARALVGGLGDAMPMRMGHGYDAHRLVEGRKLIIGGVEIAHEKGLLGHSDADVLAHAIADAVLGAAALGDIGRHFPDDDPAFKDADSIELLAAVAKEARKAGFAVQNVDATLMAQAPRISPHVAAMTANIARALGVELSAVNVKATTTEKMGFVGRGEGMAAHAVALLRAV